ncbi:MAG: AMP-binding protein, partial [Woeseiaceae bacterium]
MQTLGNCLRSTIAHNGRRNAIRDADRVLTWSEFGERVARARGVLASLGLSAGDRYGVLAQNSSRFEELKWAGFSAGIVPVPINWRLAPPEIRYILEDAACKVLFIDRDFAVDLDHPELSAWKDKAVMLPDDYDQRLAAAAIVDPVRCEPDDDAILLYTGGT